MSKISERLEQINESEAKLKIEKAQVLQEGLHSKDIEDLYVSQKYLSTITQKETPPVKSIIIDPFHLNSSFGYREKYFTINYDTLRAMSKVHIISSIIKTRKNQVLSFCQPQPDKYSTGFIIKKKSQSRYGLDTNQVNSKSDQKIINSLTDFILNCGNTGATWATDDFNTFTTKLLQDSLSLDQATFEIPRNRLGQPVEFFATDGATYRIADQTEDRRENLIKGYPISYVQILQGRVVSEFYPWELCFGVRNPTTSIYKNGYGESELEILIKTITSILNSDHYNSNFFRVGSNPRGLLRYSGNVGQNSLHEFRETWNTMMTGVNNMHKVPIINAEKLDWVSTHENNKDMEFGKYYEFLIKVTCAVYSIDPSEIGFPMSGSTEQKPMFEGNNEGRLKYSKDKGLKPILKWYEGILNKFIISQIDPLFELQFVGIDEITEENELDRDIKEVGSISTLNEIRQKRGKKSIEGGDIPLNPVFIQAKQVAMYGGQESNEQVNAENGLPEGGDLGNPFEAENDIEKSENPFEKSLIKYLNSLD